MIGPLLRTLAATACLLLAVPAWSTEDEPVPLPTSSAGGATDLAGARALVDSGQFEEALAMLRPLAKVREVEANVLFLIGLAATGASQRPGVAEADREALLDEAIAALHLMLIDRPGLVRVRLELARAFFLKGENDQSRRHFERVLAGNPPAVVVANVRRFLSEIRARRRWSLYAGFALAPDTNIGGTSDERIIHINGLPFRRDAEELTTSGIGVSVWSGGEYQYPLGERLRLRTGANVSRREYGGSRFDNTFVSGHAGPRWLVDRNTEASVLASVQRRWSASAPDYDSLGGRIEAGHRFSRRVTANARASWHDRRYPVRRVALLARHVRIWCARRTGRRLGVQVPRNEGVTKPRFSASRALAPARGQAKRRQRYGWAGLLSTEKAMVRGAEAFRSVEGNIAGIVLVRCRRTPRCQRTHARSHAFCWDPGRSSNCPCCRRGAA